MTYAVTPDQMRAAEHKAIEAGSTEQELMRAAGQGIADWIDDRFYRGEEPAVAFGLVGPGKNGGDTLVALAALVEQGWQAVAYFVDRDNVGDLPAPADALQQIERVSDLSSISAADIILDGIYGLGGRPNLSDTASAALSAATEARRASGTPIIAIDVPSGIDSETGAASDAAANADVTLTIEFIKLGLLNEPAATLAGEVEIIGIGLDPPDDESTIRSITEGLVAHSFPRRRATSGKHDHGGLLVVGGAPTFFGAPRLAAEAALRVGAGLVGAAVPRMLIGTIASQVPEVVFIPLSDSDPQRSVDAINEAVIGEHARYSAAVVGPGLGQDDPAIALLARLFGHAAAKNTAPIGFGALHEDSSPTETHDSALAAVPVVLDADALNWLAKQDDWTSLLSNITAVLTPHPGEMARLLNIDTDEVKRDPREIARKAAREWGQIVVLKGGFTVVATPEGHVFVASRATPELGTPGTGDVLSGIIGGFLAQGMQPLDAALAAIYAGTQACRMMFDFQGGRGMLARDLIAALPDVINAINQPRWYR